MVKNKTTNKNLVKMPKILSRYMAYKWYNKQGNTRGMYHNYKYLEPIKKSNPNYFFHLSKLAFTEKKWEQALKYVNKAIDLQAANTKKDFFFHKSNILFKQKKLAAALNSLEIYLEYRPEDEEALLMLGNERFKLKEWDKASKAYEVYLNLKPKDINIISKAADCYRFVEEYKKAELKYEQLLNNIHLVKDNQEKSKYYYLLGLMILHTNSKKDVSYLFNKSLHFDQQWNSEKLGIGIFHEKFYQYDYAIKAYKQNLSLNSTNYVLLYRLASLLDQLNYVEEAILYYQEALKLYKVEASWHYALGLCYEKLSDFKNAAIWYEGAKARYLKHNESVIIRFANVLNKLGRTQEANENYQEADLFKKPILATGPQHKNNISKKQVRYAISYEYYEVENNIIFYESLGGARLMGNPYAIFEQILHHRDFEDFVHVWVINSFNNIPEEYQDVDNIIYVKKGTDAYAKYVSKAKYLICNSTFEPYVTRKSNQLYLQTSHGIFYKTVGRDSTETPLGVAGATRNLLQATHIIVPNEFMAEKQPKSYSIEGIHTGEIAQVGYPRIDITKSASNEKRDHIKSTLGIDVLKKTIVYAPTWRGTTKSQNRFDTEKLISDLKLMASLDINVVFRGHTISNALLKDVEIPNNIIIPPPDIQTNELLNIADIVISDYSSVFFDFLVTERPIIHYLYDIEDYTRERGLNLDESELPGSIAKSINELINAIENKLENPAPTKAYLKAKKRFSTYDDGRSSERVIRWFFYGDTEGIDFVEKKKSQETYLLLAGGLSGLREKEINDLVAYGNKLIKEKNSVSVMIKKSVAQDDKKLELIKQLDSKVNFIVHDINTPKTTQEIAAISTVQDNYKYSYKLVEDSINLSFQREIRRLLGDTQFDHIINFETQSYYWNQIEKLLVN